MYTTLSSLKKDKTPAVWKPPTSVRTYNASVGKESYVEPIKPSNVAIPPSVWGKSLWFSFHHGAMYYPKNPTIEAQQNIINYIIAIPLMIPCEICRKHATDYIESRKDIIPIVVRSSEALFKFFWEFHNSVNQQTNKRIWSLEETIDLYRNRPLDALR